MPQDCANDVQGCALTQHFRCRRVAQQMSPHRGSLDARPLYGAADQAGDRAAGRQRSKGRVDSQEYMIVIDART